MRSVGEARTGWCHSAMKVSNGERRGDPPATRIKRLTTYPNPSTSSTESDERQHLGTSSLNAVWHVLASTVGTDSAYVRV